MKVERGLVNLLQELSSSPGTCFVFCTTKTKTSLRHSLLLWKEKPTIIEVL